MKLGTFFTINSFICAEIFSDSLDFLIIDREHSTFTLNDTRGILNSFSRNNFDETDYSLDVDDYNKSWKGTLKNHDSDTDTVLKSLQINSKNKQYYSNKNHFII